MLIGDFSWAEFCGSTSGVANILQVVGWGLTIIKIAIPIIIIIYGMLDFGKAVTAEKPEEIKASGKRLLYRAVAGIIVFFVPTIVLWLFDTLVSLNSTGEGFKNCKECLLNPGGGSCQVSEVSTGI